MPLKDLKKRKEYSKKYYQSHKEELKEKQREYKKKYRQEHKKEEREYGKQYRQLHKAELKVSRKKYSQSHREQINIIGRRSYQKCIERRRKDAREYSYLHRLERNKYNKKRSQTDPKYRINRNIRASIGRALKGKKAGRHWEDLVGYTLQELMTHLESLFDKYMNWSNQGSYWDIDHIKPKSLFNYIYPEDPEFKECWALTNLQPMEHIENMEKGKKFKEYLKEQIKSKGRLNNTK